MALAIGYDKKYDKTVPGQNMKARAFLLQATTLLLLTYSLLYFSYKFYTPELGGSDYFQYVAMYLHPLDFSVASAPTVYRQLNALIVNLIYQTGISYNTTTVFVPEDGNTRIFFASILSNYLGVFSCFLAFFAYYLKDMSRQLIPAALIAALLVFLSFSIQITTLTGLSEGWSWFLMAAIYVCYKQGRLIPFMVLAGVSIFQREMIAFIFSVYAAIDVLILKKKSRFPFLLVSALAFFSYLLIRSVILPVPGYEQQMQASSQVEFLLSNLIPTRSIILQGFLSQNILMLLGLYIIFLRQQVPQLARQKTRLEFIKMAGCFVAIYLASMGSDIGNNVGRILALLNPLYALTITDMMLAHLHDRSTPAAGEAN